MGLPETEKLNNWTVVYISGPLFLCLQKNSKNKLEELNHHDGVIFSMRGVPSIDLTARAVFDEFQEKAEQRGQTIIYTSLQPEVEKQLSHLWEHTFTHQHQTVAHALTALHAKYTAISH